VGYLERSLDTLESPDYKLWALRGLLLDYAYLGKVGAFSRLVDTARGIIEARTYKELNLACAVEEGIARAYCILGYRDGAETSLKRATLLYAELESVQGAPVLFRKIQLARTSLEVAYMFGDQADDIVAKDELERSVGAAGRIAHERGYDRHATHLKNLSERLGLGLRWE
jgi:hypothetical protein